MNSGNHPSNGTTQTARNHENLAKELAQVSGACRTLRHVAAPPFPDTVLIAEIINRAQKVLFPGVHDSSATNAAACINDIEQHLVAIEQQLAALIRSAIARHATQEDSTNSSPAAVPTTLDPAVVARDFVQNLPRIAEMLAGDVDAAWQGDPAAQSPLEVVWCYPGVLAITIHRLAHVLHLAGVPLIPRAMSEIAHARTGIDIHPGATIGPRFFIDHGTGVVIGETCVIGAGVKRYQGVTLGALSIPRNADGTVVRTQRRHPTLEDDVVVYANATILGGETRIGKGCIIGSGVWIGQSVAPWTVVTSERPKLNFRGPNTSGEMLV